jgi:hypothetical protein
VLVVEDSVRANKLAADRCPGEPYLADGPETLIQVDGARSGHPVRKQGVAAMSIERPGSAIQLAPDLGAGEAHRADRAEPSVEEHVAGAAQAITVKRVAAAAVVVEFAVSGVELAAHLAVIEPDLTVRGETIVEVNVLGDDPLRVQSPAARIVEGAPGADQFACDVRTDQPHRGGGAKAPVQVHAVLSAQRIRVQCMGGRAGEAGAGRPQPPDPGPLQTDLPIGAEALFQQHVTAHHDVIGANAVARRVTEAGAPAIELAVDAGCAQANLASGAKAFAVEEKRAARVPNT